MRFARPLSAGLVFALLSGLVAVLPPLPAAAADTLVTDKSVPVTPVATSALPLPKTPDFVAPAVKLPSGGTASVSVSGAATVGGLPVSLAAPEPGEVQSLSADPAPSAAKVTVTDSSVASLLGVRGVVLGVSRADGQTVTGKASISVDYRGWAGAFGAGFGDRLRLVKLPACALSSPQSKSCQTQMPVVSSNVDGKVSAEVDLPSAEPVVASAAASYGASTMSATEAEADEAALAAGEGAAVYAVTSGASSQNGDFTQTSLSQAGSWSAGTSGGSFSWSYPFKVPASLGGPQPSLALSYDSGSVDGKTLYTNGQAAWSGEGWAESLGGGFIERSYKSCADDGSATSDLCWSSLDNASIVFQGKSTSLVRDASGWKTADDSGWKIEKVTALNNGDNDGEAWKITTLDGTQYFFGANQRYGADAARTNSVQVVPVFGNHSWEPCYNASSFPGSMCVQAYRWNLDYVIDPSQNSMTYFYNQTTNNYGGINNTVIYGYTQSARLDRIEYGTRAGTENASPPFKVVVSLANRCQGACTYPTDFVDSPMDLQCWSTTSCPNNVSPAFFDFYRMSGVSTYTYRNGQHRLVDKWDFAHRYPYTAGEQPNLWLDSITHTGYADDGTTALAEPAVKFGDVSLANRVPGGSGVQNVHQRVAAIENGTGGRTNVTYSGVDCPQWVAGFNPHRCYPQYTSVQQGDPASWQWFNKFVVAKIDDIDLVGSTPAETWEYKYGTGSAVDGTLWAHDNAETSKIRGWSRWVGYPDVTVTHGSGSDGTKISTSSVFYRGLFQDASVHPDGFTPLWDTRFRQAAVVAPVGNADAQGTIAGTGGRCLNITGNGTTNGLAIVYADCDGRAANIWWYDWNTQTLRNPNSGRCMDVTGGGTANGTVVELYDCNYGLAQQWRWGPEGTLINPNSGRCLDANAYHTSAGTALKIWDCNISPNQIFTSRADGQIQNQQARRCMDLINGTATAGTKVGTAFCDLLASRQTWKYTPGTTAGQGSILNPTGGMCLEIETGNLLQINTCGSAAGQIWAPQTNGSIKNPGTGLCIDATEDPYSGERLTVASCSGSLTQQWAGQHADMPGFAGQARQTSTLDGAAVVASTITTYSSTTTGSRAKPNPESSNVYAYRVLPSKTQTKTFLPWNTSWRWTETQTTYDATYPTLVSQIKDLGDTSTTSDDICTSTTYFGTPQNNLIAFPKETLTTTCGLVSGDGNTLGGQRFEYDNTAYGTAPTRGLVTKSTALKQVVSGAQTWIQSGRSTYDSYGRTIDSYDALDRKTTTAYTPASGGQVTSTVVTNPASHVVTVTLNHRDQPVTAKDPNNKTTTGTYDALGRLTEVWQPGNTGSIPDAQYGYVLQASAASYTSAKELGPNGTQITSYQIYDGRLRLRQAQNTAPDGKRVITDTQYDSRGLGVKAASFYNASSGPSSALQSYADTAVESQTRNTFDGAGRQLTNELWSLNVLKSKTSNTYGGDRVGVTPPAGGTPTTTVNDARGKTLQLRQHQGGSIAGAFITTSYSYDRGGQLTKVTDPASNQWLYEYDLLGRQTKTTDPDAGISTTVYDNAGQVTSTKDARNTELYFEYDLLGRKTRTRADSVSGTVLSEAVYDTVAKGQLTSATRKDAGGNNYTSAVSSYDDSYQPLTTTVTAPGFGAGNTTLTYSVVNTYRANGAPASTSLPSVGGLPSETLTYTYYDTGLLNRLTSGAATYVNSSSYAFDGQLSQINIGAAGKQVRRNFGYDVATRRLASVYTATEDQTTPGTFGGSKFSSTYAYDLAGNITSVAGTTTGTADQEECFGYDYLRRLTQAWTQTSGTCTTPQKTGADAYWRTWSFDDAGNRLSQIDKNPDGTSGTSWTYNVGTAQGVNPHQLKSVTANGPLAGTPTRTFGYDEAGNLKTSTTETGAAQTLGWDKENHLASVTTSGSTVAGSYLYDPSGARLVASATDTDGVTRTTLYLPDGTELEKTSTGGSLIGQRYIGGVAVRSGASGLKWTIANHQGTQGAQIDPADLSIIQRRSMPYGEARGTQPLFMGTKGYVGGTKDVPTGFTHLGAREYDPSLGRFISMDPVMDIADPQQWNPYTYSNASPISRSDASGLKSCIEGEACDGKSAPDCDAKCQEENYIAALERQKKQAEEEGKKSIKDILIEVGADLLLDVLGVNDIIDCFSKGDLMACGSMVLGFMPWGKAFKAGAALFKAFDRGLSAFRAWKKIVNAGKELLSKADDLIGAAKSRLDNLLSSCAKHSFDPDTQVLMADGTTKRIGDIKVGDRVAATDPETGEVTSRTVEHVFINLDTDLTNVTVQLEDGTAEVIETTSHHPFWDATTKEWTSASTLAVGHKLLTANGTAATVAAVNSFTGSQEMRDLTVADIHTYYVMAADTPVLVHNCGPDLDTMSQAGQAANKNGLTDAGRAYQKHSDRGELPKVNTHPERNAGGQDLLDDVLTDPHSDFQPIMNGNFKGGTRVVSNRIINDQFVGAVYDAAGKLRYFGGFS